MDWLPIDQAPNDQIVLVVGFNYGKPDKGRHYCMAKRTNDEWWDVDERSDGTALAYLTHYMPLPPPPEQNK